MAIEIGVEDNDNKKRVIDSPILKESQNVCIRGAFKTGKTATLALLSNRILKAKESDFVFLINNVDEYSYIDSLKNFVVVNMGENKLSPFISNNMFTNLSNSSAAKYLHSVSQHFVQEYEFNQPHSRHLRAALKRMYLGFENSDDHHLYPRIDSISNMVGSLNIEENEVSCLRNILKEHNYDNYNLFADEILSQNGVVVFDYRNLYDKESYLKNIHSLLTILQAIVRSKDDYNVTICIDETLALTKMEPLTPIIRDIFSETAKNSEAQLIYTIYPGDYDIKFKEKTDVIINHRTTQTIDRYSDEINNYLNFSKMNSNFNTAVYDDFEGEPTPLRIKASKPGEKKIINMIN